MSTFIPPTEEALASASLCPATSCLSLATHLPPHPFPSLPQPQSQGRAAVLVHAGNKRKIRGLE